MPLEGDDLRVGGEDVAEVQAGRDRPGALVLDQLKETQDLQWRGRPRSDDRLVGDGIPWRLATGAPWRDLPARFGPRGVGVLALPALAARRRLGAGAAGRGRRGCRSIGAVIPRLATEPRRGARFGRTACRERNRVERPVNRLKRHRATATRDGKAEVTFRALPPIACILLWL